MTDTSKKAQAPRIAHELPKRIRFHYARLFDPLLDSAYLQAVIENLPGVSNVRINRRGTTIVVEYDGLAENRERILETLNDPPSETFTSGDVNIRTGPEPADLCLKGALTMASLGTPLEISAPLALFLGLPTILKGIDTFFNEGIKIETLDAAAVSMSLVRGDFFTSNSIVSLLALGEYLEASSENRSTELLKSLLRPQVEFAWVERDGEEIRVLLPQVMAGDRVICGPGDIIPVDGTVAEGEASVNQSSITGESVSIHLHPGEEALSGSVVEEGRLIIQAERVGSETSMARITRFMENSLRMKSESQTHSAELADRLVPVTLGLGAVIFLLTRDISRATAVLTVDYACAIKLANPVAVKTAMYDAAHSGVLVKGAQALDALAVVDTIVLDKTGTLTNGVLNVTEVIPTGDLAPDELLALAAGAEQHYDHPVAHAVIHAAEERGLELPTMSNVDYIVAHGVSAYVDDERVLAGSLHFLQDDELVDCSGVNDVADKLRHEGNNLLYISRSGILEGVIAFRDDLRPEAPEVLHGFKESGIRRVVVITGDHRDTARAVIGPLDEVSELHYEMKPEDKSRIVKELMAEGAKVAFVGDGVNDAPAMITAQVGICMPGGSNLAKEAAMVLLLEEDLKTLLKARQVATHTRMVIDNCFKSAVGFNSIVLLLATLGFLPPVASALLHNMSTVGILGYAALGNRGAGKR